MKLKLEFAGIVMDCWYDETGAVTSFLCIPANNCSIGHPLCLSCTIKTPAAGRVGRETVFPGALIRGRASELADYEEEGTFDLWLAPADLSGLAEEGEGLDLCEALLDPLLDAAMLGRAWWFEETEGKISPRDLLQRCLNSLKQAGLLPPDRLTRRVHGWLSGFWLTHLTKSSTGLEAVLFGTAVSRVGGGPRIFVWPAGKLGELDKSKAFSISVSPRPRVLEGRVTLAEETLDQCLAWVRLNRKVLLKHWRGKLDSAGLVHQLVSISGEKMPNPAAGDVCPAADAGCPAAGDVCAVAGAGCANPDPGCVDKEKCCSGAG